MELGRNVLIYSSSKSLGDEPMLMRLKPRIKYDAEGNRIYDGKSRKWYAHFRWKGQEIGSSLNAYEHEVKKAHLELGYLIERLRNGEVVGSSNKQLKKIIKDPFKFYNKQFAGLWKNHVCRLLGEYRVSELTADVMAQYMEDHWGLNEDEELQVMFSSFEKEILVLQKAIRLVKPHFSVRKELLSGLKYNESFKEQLPPLMPAQLYQATLQAKGYWGKIFLIMLYTGMEAKDIFDLKPRMIDGGKIKKLRHKNKYRKNKTEIDMPIVPQLKKVLDSLPEPLDKDQSYFTGYEPWKVSKAIRDIFEKAGLSGYGAKSLRRYVGEEINSQYMAEADKAVKEALAHSKNSKETARYTRPRQADLYSLMDSLAGRIAACGK